MADPITLAEEEALKTGEEMNLETNSPAGAENFQIKVDQPVTVKSSKTIENDFFAKQKTAMYERGRQTTYGNNPQVREVAKGATTATSEALGENVNAQGKTDIKKLKLQHTAEQYAQGDS
jgi:hypothetical protein